MSRRGAATPPQKAARVQQSSASLELQRLRSVSLRSAFPAAAAMMAEQGGASGTNRAERSRGLMQITPQLSHRQPIKVVLVFIPQTHVQRHRPASLTRTLASPVRRLTGMNPASCCCFHRFLPHSRRNQPVFSSSRNVW